ncbi:ATPase-like, ParA/MinD [Pseudopedobacter saltans DSM 12145]|uniref:Iron-sulfur cluster carrier protein n=1 Tax=Pseudopedobacter saltans (strain ATCC 51119 / DSM 12145 / JCM 21818 / CCUG 39354 / LMG 10337 / NBRC 100064 / NCIMB 13643) TaxID=762903 RepID=F0S9H8_PSESL|nr:Mrp/NBP35 family ATP-binding protein [Pseudopedobacter saltans]ADY53531.1 ATPase-like, ParA/MinD [Pseudopedobacter saltans DSM 12145]
MITREKVLDALRNVEDPDLKKDLVTLNMIENLVIEGNKVSFSVVLTTPACPLKEMLENACRNAVKHFVSQDAEISIHMTSRVTSPVKQFSPNIKNIIAVSSGKGGVGKSTVAANLAIGLSLNGAKVGLIDADIYGPSVPIMFGVQDAKPLASEVNGKTLIEPIEKYGVKILSLGFFTDPDQPVPWRGPMASNAVKQLFNDADWGELDYLVVDLPPGTGDIHITITQGYPISGAIIVTTPQQVAVADTTKGLGMFMMNAINVPILGIVENMSYFTPTELPDNKYYIFGKEGGKKMAEKFKVPFLGEIPLVQSVSEAGDGGQPIALDKNSIMSKIFVDLAQKVAQQIAINNGIAK